MFEISPDGRRRICATNPTCSRSAYSSHHQDQCTHTISQRRLETVIFATLSVGLPAHPLPYEERRPASRRRTTLGTTQGICDATQPDSEKHMLKRRVSARTKCRTASVGHLPQSASATRITKVSSPATRPPALVPAHSLYKQHFRKSVICFKHLYERY